MSIGDRGPRTGGYARATNAEAPATGNEALSRHSVPHAARFEAAQAFTEARAMATVRRSSNGEGRAANDEARSPPATLRELSTRRAHLVPMEPRRRPRHPQRRPRLPHRRLRLPHTRPRRQQEATFCAQRILRPFCGKLATNTDQRALATSSRPTSGRGLSQDTESRAGWARLSVSAQQQCNSGRGFTRVDADLIRPDTPKDFLVFFVAVSA